MKTTKKKGFLALIVALIATFTLAGAGSAFADGENSITIKDAEEGHQYEAYQIFAGNYSAGVLTDVVWGNGINESNFLGELEESRLLPGITTGSSAADVAEAIGGLDLSQGNKTLLDIAEIADRNRRPIAAINLEYNAGSKAYFKVVQSPGYYLIRDKENSQSDKEYGYYTEFILEVVGKAEARPKGSVPQSDKTVANPYATDKDPEYKNIPINISPELGDNLVGYGKAADYNVGDAVKFRLHGTVADNILDYKKYSYSFVDEQGPGFDPVDVKSVEVIAVSGGKYFKLDNECFVAIAEGSKLTVSIGPGKNLLDLNGKGTHVTWSAENGKWVEANSNDKIVVGADLEFIVTYESVLNNQIFKNDKLFQGPAENTMHLVYSNNPNEDGDTGTTPEDKTYTWTFTLDNTKINDKEEVLRDAEFVLYKYKDDIEENGTKLYAVFDNKGKVSWTEDSTLASKRVSDESGKFVFPGIDVGTYWLQETAAPAGYNTIKDQKVEILCTYKADDNGKQEIDEFLLRLNDSETLVSAKDATSVLDIMTASVNLKIENRPGSGLPETGGIGTIIFTVVGIGLMVAFAIVFVKRRRSQE